MVRAAQGHGVLAAGEEVARAVAAGHDHRQCPRPEMPDQALGGGVGSRGPPGQRLRTLHVHDQRMVGGAPLRLHRSEPPPRGPGRQQTARTRSRSAARPARQRATRERPDPPPRRRRHPCRQRRAEGEGPPPNPKVAPRDAHHPVRSKYRADREPETRRKPQLAPETWMKSHRTGRSRPGRGPHRRSLARRLDFVPGPHPAGSPTMSSRHGGALTGSPRMAQRMGLSGSVLQSRVPVAALVLLARATRAQGVAAHPGELVGSGADDRRLSGLRRGDVLDAVRSARTEPSRLEVGQRMPRLRPDPGRRASRCPRGPRWPWCGRPSRLRPGSRGRAPVTGASARRASVRPRPRQPRPRARRGPPRPHPRPRPRRSPRG